ncbi:uncharacterized protein LOC108677112 isoform X1 [Hyalella azteca]|uniref:Uncharacterized protein LOC108677112 isoform X1 n=1 Tax=Hyalella azteca TaxID=294128 RepID=A0A8B7P3R0_HYAAZ|nr:uncharacterized protein LOC108677112 isoform X1 [Hyalella azteca]
MMKPVCLVLLLTATFAYSGVEGENACTTAIKNNLNYTALNSAFHFCASDPAGRAALIKNSGKLCAHYDYFTGDITCEIRAAPFMKCAAKELGYLNANDGSIKNTKILAEYKTYATSDPKCKVDIYNFAVYKCGTTIANYAFLAKAACLFRKMDQYTR